MAAPIARRGDPPPAAALGRAGEEGQDRQRPDQGECAAEALDAAADEEHGDARSEPGDGGAAGEEGEPAQREQVRPQARRDEGEDEGDHG